MLNMAVLGCGRIGAMHARNLSRHEKTRLSTVYDIHRPAAEALAQELDIKAADSIEDLLADGSIEAVLIATATDTHADLIEAAAKAGKAILCEKPIDINIDRVNRCAEAIADYDVPIQIGFNRRFDPGHRAARMAVEAGEIGDLHQVIITSRDPALPPRDYLEVAGGLLRDMTIHDFDLARFMLADEPVEVFAVAGALIDPALGAELNEVDTTMIVMRCADGKQCHINGSRTAVYGYDQRVELLGRNGMIQSDNRRPHEMRRYGAQSVEVAAPYLFFFIERYQESFYAEVDSFVESVIAGRTPEVNFEDGRRALLLAEAAYKSLAERRLVRVDEVG